MEKWIKRGGASKVVGWYFPDATKNKIISLIGRSIPNFRSETDREISEFGGALSCKPPPNILQVLDQEFLKEGIDLSREYGGIGDLGTLILALTPSHLLTALTSISALLRRFDDLAAARHDMSSYRWAEQGEFESRVNNVLAETSCPYRIKNAALVESARDAAAVLRQALLKGEVDPASCANGDVQVEMVSSSVQTLLRPNALIVDYGAGLGRVLEGMETADLFKQVRYLCVEESPAPRLRELAKRLNVGLWSREQFLQNTTDAHAIMVVNTLHHMPFSDIPRQFNKMLNSLEPNGILLIHEMGKHLEPEPRNVPWLTDDIKLLFDGIDGLTLNARHTHSRRGVPLAHCLVHDVKKREFTPDFERNAKKVWSKMKQSALQKIEELSV